MTRRTFKGTPPDRDDACDATWEGDAQVAKFCQTFEPTYQGLPLTPDELAAVTVRQRGDVIEWWFTPKRPVDTGARVEAPVVNK